MATVYSIDRTGGSAADYSMKKLSESDFSLKGTDTVNGVTKSTYTIASGDGNYPSTVVFQSKSDPKGNGGSGMNSGTLALNSWARAVLDDGSVVLQPVSCVMHINVPGGVLVEVADLRDMIENLFSFTYTTLTAKEPDDVRLSKLALFGVTQLI